jgi:hypothetical protein
MHGLNVSYGEELAVLPRLLGRCGSDAGQRRWSCLVECETPLWLSWCLRARAGRRALGVGHDDRLKDVPCLSLVFSVDRDSYLELFVHFLEVFLQCYGRSEYARGNRSEKIGRSDQWCPSLTRALTRRNFFNVGLLATARAYLSVSETRAETNVTGRAGVP